MIKRYSLAFCVVMLSLYGEKPCDTSVSFAQLVHNSAQSDMITSLVGWDCRKQSRIMMMRIHILSPRCVVTMAFPDKLMTFIDGLYYF